MLWRRRSGRRRNRGKVKMKMKLGRAMRRWEEWRTRSEGRAMDEKRAGRRAF
jgi:hypothetical protein